MSKASSPRGFNIGQYAMFVAGIGFFGLSVVALGVLPGIRLERSIQEHAPSTERPFTPSEAHGRAIYAAEGCSYCHTEQVRNTPEDIRRWGPPIEPWETKFERPQLWGTQRTGPDLAREAGVRSDDWHLAHLYNPRLVVPGSVMPGYPWLFEGSPDKPAQAALDLLAYLNTQGRARLEAKGKITGDGSALEPEMLKEIPDFQTVDNPSRPYPIAPGTADPMPLRKSGQAQDGQKVFAQYCSGCHGEAGDGKSAAAKVLQPEPADLTAFDYSDAALVAILKNGVSGSSMPAWRDLNSQQMADLIAFIHTLHRDTGAADPEDAGVIKRGEALFADNCSACHGQGDTSAATDLAPRPFNFAHVRPSAAEIRRVLQEGVPGSAMPAFTALNDADRQALAAYVRSLYRDGGAGQSKGE